MQRKSGARVKGGEGKGENPNTRARPYRGPHFSAEALNLKFGLRSRHCAHVCSDKLLAATQKVDRDGKGAWNDPRSIPGECSEPARCDE